MKRFLAIFLISIFLLGSMVNASADGVISTEISDQNETVDYNRYIYSHGFFGYIDQELVVYNRPQIQFMNCNEEKPVIRNCIRPDCDHKGAWCSSYLQDFNGLYASNGFLYNIERIDDQYVLRRMDKFGENRETALELREMNAIYEKNSGIEFKYQVFQDQLVLELTTKKLGKRITQLLLYDLNDPDQAPVLVFDNSEIEDYFYGLGKLYENQILFYRYQADARLSTDSTWIYDIETGETRMVSDHWVWGCFFILEDNRVDWFDPSVGFCSISLEDLSENCYREADSSVEYGPSAYDDQYLYLTNSLPPLNAMGVVDPEKYGLYVYDHEGNVIQYYSTVDQEVYPMYVLSTEDKVFFYDFEKQSRYMNLIPAYYILKSEFGTENAQIYRVGE